MGQAAKHVCSDSGRAATQRSQKHLAGEARRSRPKPRLQMSNLSQRLDPKIHDLLGQKDLKHDGLYSAASRVLG